MYHRYANSYFEADINAAEERRQAAVAYAGRMCHYRASGMSNGPRTSRVSLRRALAFGLIRAGELLGGAPAPAGHVVRNAG
jgi:hypothetical protein